MHWLTTWRVYGISLMMVMFFSHSHAFDAAAVFDKKCSSCHSIGGGDDVGPDLKGIEDRRKLDWIVKIIQESGAMIQAGDPDAVALFEKYRRKKMPDQDLSRDEILKLLAFIKGGGAGEKGLSVRAATEATPEDIEKGHQLFTGELRMANGGPPCISCHSAGVAGILGGGSLGPDLTMVFSTYKDTGLTKALDKLAFPVMSDVYLGKNLTPEEIFYLKGFFLSTDKAGVRPLGINKKFLFLGVLGTFLLFGALDLAWRTRRTETIRPALQRSIID